MTVPLLAHHVEHLRASGLSDETIAAAGLCSVTDGEEARRLLHWSPDGSSPPVPAIAFPYCEDYVRLRPDNPRVAKHGELAKYEAPLRQRPRIYIPKNVRPDIGNVSADLWLTEGEKKALAGCEAGLPTIAASGVSSWHDVEARRTAHASGGDRWTLHPDAVPLISRGRPVTIVFDSNIDTKPDVQRAAIKLAEMCTEAGAIVSIAYIRAVDGTSSFGLDDLYRNLGRSAAELRRVLAIARRPVAPTPQLEWLAKNWGDWSASQQKLELERAVPWVRARSNDAEKESWIAAAVRRLDVPPKELRALLKLKQSNGQPTTSSGWMTAPGYCVSVEPESVGVFQISDKGGSRLIAAAPINVVATGRDESGQLYSTIRYLHGADEHRVTRPRVEIAGPELLGLAAQGAPVTQSNRGAVQTFLQLQEQTHHASLPRANVYTRLGWSPDLRSYALGQQVIGGEGEVIASVDEAALQAFTAKGDLKTYVDLMREVIKQTPAAEAAWATAYAAPLLRHLGERSWLLSFHGPSGHGKTAVQSVALSPYGRPGGMMLTGDATPTAVEAHLARCRDLPAVIDDTQQTRSRALLDGLAYQVGGGIGRGRGTVSGSLRPLASWLTLGFVSGEKPFLKLGVAAGARNRTLELRVEPLCSSSFAQQVHVALTQHHGLTGPMYLQALIDRLDQAELSAWCNRVRSSLPGPLDELVRHVTILVAGDFLARQYVFGEDRAVAERAALAMGNEILSAARAQPDAAVSPTDAAYEEIVAWVTENGLAFEEGGPRCFGAYIDAAEVGGRRVVAILPGPLSELAKDREFNVAEVMHGLLERKLLITQEASRLMKRTPALGEDRPRAYWIVLPGSADPGPDGGVGGSGPDGSSPSAPGQGGSGPRGDRAGRVPATGAGPRAAMGHDPGQLNPSTNQVVSADLSHQPSRPGSDVTSESRDAADGSPQGKSGDGGAAGTAGQEGGDRSESTTTTAPSTQRTTVAPPVPEPSRRDRAVRPSARITMEDLPRPTVDYVTRSSDVSRACEHLAGRPRLGLDIETYATGDNADGAAALDSFRNGVRLLQIGDASRVCVFDVRALGGVPAAVHELLKTPELVGYNLQFDARNLQHHFQMELPHIVDLLAGSLLADGYRDYRKKGAHTLKADVRRRLDCELPKEEQMSDWGVGTLRPEQLEYAARDVAVLLPLHDVVRVAATDVDVVRAWALENEVLAPLIRMELAGIQIDRERVTDLSHAWQREANEAAAAVQAALGSINLNSPKQLQKAIKNRLGLDLPKTGEDELDGYVAKAPVLAELIRYRQKLKAVSSYAEPWLAASARDGRIRAEFRPLAAPTGRMGCANPNIQAVPRDPNVRNCFVAAPGHVLIAADYSVIELRVIAEVIGDAELRRCFNATPPIDPHRRTAAAILRCEVEAVSKEERSRAKAANFGFAFGMGPSQFVDYARSNYGIEFTSAQASKIWRTYLSLYRGIAKWHQSAKYKGRRVMHARTASGRLRVFEKFSVTEYLNTPIQGTSADGMKRALALLHPYLVRLGARLVNVIHDEVVVECPVDRAPEVKLVVEKCMVEGMAEYVRAVPVVVESAVGPSWGKA